MDLFLLRLLFLVLVVAASYVLAPFNLQPIPAAIAGGIIGLGIIIFEMRIRTLSLKRLLGACIGSVCGIFGAYLFSLVIHSSLHETGSGLCLELLVLLLISYIGLN